jgi:type 1 fimbria pilin
MAPELQASANGGLDLAWDQVSDAKGYQIQILDKDGTAIKTENSKSNRASLKRLKPGDYTITLQSIDGIGRIGPAGTPRPLQVPEYSDVRAPKIKSLNVK